MLIWGKRSWYNCIVLSSMQDWRFFNVSISKLQLHLEYLKHCLYSNWFKALCVENICQFQDKVWPTNEVYKLGLSCAKLRLNWASLPISRISKYLSQIQLSFKFLIKMIIVLTFEIYEAKLPDFQPLKVIFHSGCLPWRSTSIFSKFRFKKRSYLIRH